MMTEAFVNYMDYLDENYEHDFRRLTNTFLVEQC